jgi:hypothetical protein
MVSHCTHWRARKSFVAMAIADSPVLEREEDMANSEGGLNLEATDWENFMGKGRLVVLELFSLKKFIFDHPTFASVWFWPSNFKIGYL